MNVEHAVSIAIALVPAGALASASAGGNELKLVPPDASSRDRLGSAVALQDGIAVVGASYDVEHGVRSGSVYLFDAATGRVLHKLLPGDGDDFDSFGGSVAIDRGRVLVGAAADDDLGNWSGSVYIFDAASGRRLWKLLPDDGAAGDLFGGSVAILGDTVLVGSPGADERGTNSGAAYLFDASTGQQVAKLVPPVAAPNARFGSSVALDPGLAVVGAPEQSLYAPAAGLVHLFDLDTGSPLARIAPADPTPYSRFGSSVAIDGPVLVIGAREEASAGPYAGATYVFDVATGQQLAKLLAHGGAPNHQFGITVAVSADLILVGALQPVTAYLFDARTGLEIGQLHGSDAGPQERYGDSVALDRSLALVGARFEHAVGFQSGAAYLHDISSGTAVPYCFGDGEGEPCPCANSGAYGRGCANSTFPAGASLFAGSQACVSDEGFALQVGGSAPEQIGVFFQADAAAAGGDGLPLGDGLRCADGNALRLEARIASQDGSVLSSGPIAALGGVSAGDVRHYQWWYRDPESSPCGSGSNLSNGLRILWGP